MNITQDVITDLLPVYLAGEASASTRALLEEYLREHPEFAATVRAAADRSAALLRSTEPGAPVPDHERATLDRVRRFNRRRTVLLALAMGTLLTSLSFSFDNTGVRWFMLRDSGFQALLWLLVAFACSLAYLKMGRRVKT
jgi:predicted anti-sigma-YlaC factor YlaD